MVDTVVLVHGRHVQTEGWETLVWGDGVKIGTAPLGLHLAMEHDAQLIFGTGASERDGLKECEFTLRYLHHKVAEVNYFPEFRKLCAWDYALHAVVYDAYERAAILKPFFDNAHLDTESTDTVSEVKNAVLYAKSVGATQLIQVTSPFHAARCMSISAKLLEDGFDFGNVVPMIVSAKSSTAKCRAGTTVILEHPHRGDDSMINSPLAPHEVFPRMFKLPPTERMKFFVETSERLKELGV